MKNIRRHARRAAAVLGALSAALAALLGPHGLVLGIVVAVTAASLAGLVVAVVMVGRGMFRSVLDVVGRTIDSGDRSDRACRLMLAMRGNDSCLEPAPVAAALTVPGPRALPPAFGIFLGAHDDGTVSVFTGGRTVRAGVSPSVVPGELRPGQEVVLNEELNVIVGGYEPAGEVVVLKELLADSQRALVIAAPADQERLVRLVEPLLRETLLAGDLLLLEPRSGYLYGRLPAPVTPLCAPGTLANG
jgi:hypothetical protein